MIMFRKLAQPLGRHLEQKPSLKQTNRTQPAKGLGEEAQLVTFQNCTLWRETRRKPTVVKIHRHLGIVGLIYSSLC